MLMRNRALFAPAVACPGRLVWGPSQLSSPVHPAACVPCYTHRTMRFGSTAKVLAKCMFEHYRISECTAHCVLKHLWGRVAVERGA